MTARILTTMNPDDRTNSILASTNGVVIMAIVGWDASVRDVRRARQSMNREMSMLTASGAVRQGEIEA